MSATTKTSFDDADGVIRRLRARCLALRFRLLPSLPPSKLSPPSTLSLLRLLDAELRFLSRLSSSPSSFPPICSNVGYLESVARVLSHPAVRGVSRVCKPIPTQEPVHVDVVCTFHRDPAWILVSDRNPDYVSWTGTADGRQKGLRTRVERVVCAARSIAEALRPASVLFVFSKGVGNETEVRLAEEFGAVEINFFGDWDLFEEVEEGWVSVRPVESARVFEVKIDSGGGENVESLGDVEDEKEVVLGDRFGSLISKMRPRGGVSEEVVNFDTTALVAMVSGISNGGTERLLKASEAEMRARFKSNYEFVIAQAMSELQHPILAELEVVIAGKKGIICKSIVSEFKEIVSMCGGPNEKFRANQVMKRVSVVPDSPSARVMDLPTTRKIALKNKIVFGTGDHFHAPTLTANMGFVRAISQTGMSLLTIEHRPRALTGD